MEEQHSARVLPAMNSHVFYRSSEETSTLSISNIPMHRMQKLQQLLAECGAIQVLNTRMLGVRIFNN